jgi:hypothetical protein
MRHVDDESHTPGSANPSNDFLEIWEYDGGNYDQDLNGGNDDTIGNQLYTLVYDAPSDSWSCQSSTTQCIALESYGDTTYDGSGTILLNMGVWWE